MVGLRSVLRGSAARNAQALLTNAPEGAVGDGGWVAFECMAARSVTGQAAAGGDRADDDSDTGSKRKRVEGCFFSRKGE